MKKHRFESPYASNDHHFNGGVRKRHAQTTVANVDILSRHTIQKNTPFLKSSLNLLRIYLKTDNVIVRLHFFCTLFLFIFSIFISYLVKAEVLLVNTLDAYLK